MPVDALEEGHRETLASHAVAPGVARRNRELRFRAPRLHQAYRLGARGVFINDLTNPRPESGDVPVVALSFAGGKFIQKLSGKKRLKLQGILTQRGRDECRPVFEENILPLTLDAAIEFGGKARQERW